MHVLHVVLFKEDNMFKISVAVLALLSPSGAAVGDTWNVDVFGGAGIPGSLRWDGVARDTDAGKVFGLAVSRNDTFLANADVGIELSRSSYSYTNEYPSSIAGTSLIAFAKVNLSSIGNFQPYLGAGLGVVNIAYTNASPSYANAEIEFAGQLSIGMRYPLTPALSAFVEARYIRAKDAHVAYSPARRDADFRSKSIVFGIRKPL
jgi:opacity protein-like surface antigen